jgi:hypothetical protein
MTSEFQREYAEHHRAAVEQGFLESAEDRRDENFIRYLRKTGMNGTTKEALLNRFGMHHKLGNNQYFEGSGLTKNLVAGSKNQFGVVETFNFERKMMNVGHYKRAGAIHILTNEITPLC